MKNGVVKHPVGDDEWDFYDVPSRDDLTLDSLKYHDILPNFGFIKNTKGSLKTRNKAIIYNEGELNHVNV